MSVFLQIDTNNAENDDFGYISCLHTKTQSEEKQIQSVPIFLIGMRACGKTTLGQALAQCMRCPFVDTDQTICDVAKRQGVGADIASIVANEGWEGFREREAQALRHAVQPGIVIATGGGMILRPDNREYMRQSGFCVYLEANADELWRRLEKNPKSSQRPSFTLPSHTLPSHSKRPKSPSVKHEISRHDVSREEIRALLAERESLYRQTAHHVLSVQGKPDDIVAELVALWRAPII